jgi:hypothetical protein
MIMSLPMRQLYFQMRKGTTLEREPVLRRLPGIKSQHGLPANEDAGNEKHPAFPE